MIGKVWIFITAFSFCTNIHHAQSECMPNDLKTHLYDELLEDHIFEIKIFPSETKENELLSVINTLCSSWTKNKNKDHIKFKILQTFEIMLLNFFQSNFEKICVDLNCTDAYTVSWVNATVFGDMYGRSCNGSKSDLKCPSKSITTISPSITAVENTTLFTTVDSITTAHKSSPSLIMVSPNITAPENSSAVSSASTENKALKDAQSTIKTCSGVLVFSLLLNIVLFLLVFFQKKPLRTAEQTPEEKVILKCF
ncbi:uncharacterized protein LOC143721885 isoform X2 [Siphateles boraxobius]|uniref:uncharacterized protein LOC143721885 isoform X2 n=1 Tax=Siphateles boraxobius TaxID=180520 RepID=UPI0040632DCA